MSQSGVQVRDLFTQAVADGNLSPESAVVLANYGDRIQDRLGFTVDDVASAEVVLLTTVMDDSSSIRFVAGNTEALREGYNSLLEAVGGARKRDDVLAALLFLNGGLIHAYVALSGAPRLDRADYNPSGGTPLYDRVLETLAQVAAKLQELEAAGIACRTITLVLTDGADTESRRSTVSDIEKVVRVMLSTEKHLIYAFGVDDGSTHYREIFARMGIRDDFVIVSASDPKDIRAKLGLVSRSVSQASQTAALFSKTAKSGLGGFAN